MLYPIDARMTRNGFSSSWNQGLSATDREWLAKTYPRADAPPPPSDLGGTVWCRVDGNRFAINYEGRVQVSGELRPDKTITGTWS
jgi:hypothetical protein